MSHENFITFNCNYVYIKYFNHRFNFCVSKSFYYSTDDALLRKAFTDILNCCDIQVHFNYVNYKNPETGDCMCRVRNNYSIGTPKYFIFT